MEINNNNKAIQPYSNIAIHKPVLSNEVIKLLDPQPGEFLVDGTFGAGGHSKLIWEKIQPTGKLLAIDWNEESIKKRTNIFTGCVVGNFADLPEILEKKKYLSVDGLLLDLGVSSDELENSGRGFSFQKDEPLLMTYSDEQKPVKDILTEISENELMEVIRRYGEERFAKRIAFAIKRQQRIKPITTSGELAAVIAQAVPRRGKIHPATRTFMALRIYANQELENLESILNNLERFMAPNGRVAIISFHSLEDRIVKNEFKRLAKENKAEILTKKPITPTREEIKQNPRSRSAKLRAIKFL